MATNNHELIDAVQDLCRVFIATSGKFESKSDAVRQLNEFAIPPSRIAAILSMKLNDVTSIISRDRKKKGKGA